MNSVSWPGISESTRHRLLNRPALVAARPPRRRARGPTAIGPLAVSEAAADPWSVRLEALLPLWLPLVRRRLPPPRPEVEKPATGDHPRQMGHRLAPYRPPPCSGCTGGRRRGRCSNFTPPLI